MHVEIIVTIVNDLSLELDFSELFKTYASEIN